MVIVMSQLEASRQFQKILMFFMTIRSGETLSFASKKLFIFFIGYKRMSESFIFDTKKQLINQSTGIISIVKSKETSDAVLIIPFCFTNQLWKTFQYFSDIKSKFHIAKTNLLKKVIYTKVHKRRTINLLRNFDIFFMFFSCSCLGFLVWWLKFERILFHF